MADEVNNLPQMVLGLVLIGIMIGVGMIVLDKFGSTVHDLTTIADEVVTLTAGAGQLANFDLGVTSVTTPMFNSTNSSDSYIVTTANWTTSNGVLSFDPNLNNGSYNFTYIYKKNSTTTASMREVRGAIAPIASDWLPLIVTVTVLGIILTIVLRSFAIRR